MRPTAGRARARRRRSRLCRSTATRSSRRAAAGRSPGATTRSSLTRGSSPRRRASRYRTTSTPRSASTTASATSSPRSAGRSSRCCPSASRRGSESTPATASFSATRPGIDFMPAATDGTSNCWLTCITVDPGSFGADREQIRLALEAEDIEARPGLEADAPAARVRGQPDLRRRRLRPPVRAGALPAEWLGDDRRRPGPRRRHAAGDAQHVASATASRRPRPRPWCRRRRASATSGRCDR